MKSILQDEKECYICKTTSGLHLHHVFFGTYRRKQSDKYGVTVCLCQKHHMELHAKRDLQLRLFEIAQTKFEEILGAHIFKSSGKPTLAPISDKRQAIDVSNVNNEFNKIMED